jgi:hypothetical protein
MTLKRLVIVLGSTLAAMLAVVVLRAENRRLHYLISRSDARDEALTTEIREKELELARLTNPHKIRERAATSRLQDAPTAAPRETKSGKKRSPSP